MQLKCFLQILLQKNLFKETQIQEKTFFFKPNIENIEQKHEQTTTHPKLKM